MNTETAYTISQSNNVDHSDDDYMSEYDLYNYMSEYDLYDYLMYQSLDMQDDEKDFDDIYEDYDMHERMLYRIAKKNRKHSNNISENKEHRAIKKVLFTRKNVNPKSKSRKQPTVKRSFMYDISTPIETDQKIYNGNENLYMCETWFDDYLMDDSHFWNEDNGYCSDDYYDFEVDYHKYYSFFFMD